MIWQPFPYMGLLLGLATALVQSALLALIGKSLKKGGLSPMALLVFMAKPAVYIAALWFSLEISFTDGVLCGVVAATGLFVYALVRFLRNKQTRSRT